MVSKLVMGSVVLIAVGLVLVVIGNPSLRLVTGATPSGTTFTFTGTTFTRTGNFSGTFPFNFTRTAGTFGGRGSLTTDEVESLVGVALVGAGLLLEVFSVFIRPKPVSAPA
ncbi:MAG TPA: hypothetical protein VED22_03775 [Nitrososphaerales archaeon]|nr:hypothetical protein [Nitrososphaerales archaeon]